MKIQKDDCLALVIDIQERLFPFISGIEALLKNQIKLIKGMQILSVPILVTEQYRKGIGQTIDSIMQLFGDEFEYMEKMEFSCLENQAIKDFIIGSRKKNLIIIGIEAHVCVLQTVLDSIQLGLNPVVIADCIGSRNNYNKETAIERMRSAGATITTMESVLFELLVKSGTPEFKEISKLVK